MKKLSKTQKKQRTKRYFILSMALLIVLAASAYWNTSSSGLEDAVRNFIYNKSDISQTLGSISSVHVQTGGGSSGNVIPVTSKITGSNQVATLNLNAMQMGSGWVFSNIRLISKKGAASLTPFFINDSSLYADGATGDGRINENQKVFLEVFLNSTKEQANQSAPIVQTLTITDDNGGVVAHSDDIARYVPDKNEFYDGQGMRFTSSFANLKSGRYQIKTTFRDKQGRILESFTKPVEIAPSANKLAIHSVEYFDGDDLARKIRPEFNADQNVYVRLNLNGLHSKDAAVAGQVALEVKDSSGKLVANLPNFATFNQLLDQQKSIVVDGKLQLKDPDIYQLSFKVKDANANQMSVHNERVLVTLP